MKRLFSQINQYRLCLAAMLMLSIISNAQNVSISPTKGRVGKKIAVTITGNNAQFGTSETCVGKTDCYETGSKLKFQVKTASSTFDREFLMDSINVIDETKFTAYITPSDDGVFKFKLDNGLQTLEDFSVLPAYNPQLKGNFFGNAGEKIKIKLGLKDAKFGTGADCKIANECVVLGNALFIQGSTTVDRTINLENVNYLDSATAEAEITLPIQTGVYSLSTLSGFGNVVLSVFSETKPSFSIWNLDNQGEFRLFANDGYFGTDESCKLNKRCILLTDSIFYASYKSEFKNKVSMEILDISDLTKVFVKLNLPRIKSNIYLITEDSVISTNNYSYDNAKKIAIYPNNGIAGKKLDVTITGLNTNFGNGVNCNDANKCTEFKNKFYVYNSFSQIADSIQLENVINVDSNTITATLKIPLSLSNTNMDLINNGMVSANRFNIMNDREIKYNVYSALGAAHVNDTITAQLVTDYGYFGKGAKCTVENKCINIENGLNYIVQNENGIKTDTGVVNFIEIIEEDSVYFKATFKVPNSVGYYSFYSQNGVKSERLNVYGPIPRKIDCRVGQAIDSNTVQLVIESGFDLELNNGCKGIKCINVDSTINYVNLITNEKGKLKLNHIVQYDYAISTEIDIYPGKYYFYLSDTTVKGDTLTIYPKAILVNQFPYSYCVNDSTEAILQLYGKAPFTINYVFNNTHYKLTNIVENFQNIKLKTNTIGNGVFRLDTISDANLLNPYNSIYSSYGVYACNDTLVEVFMVSDEYCPRLQWNMLNPNFSYIIETATDTLFDNIIDSVNINVGNNYYLANGKFNNFINEKFYSRIRIKELKNVSWKTISYIFNGCYILGIEDDTQLDCKIYPNPTNASFQITNYDKIGKVRIKNLTGVVVSEYSSAQESYDINSLSSGVYVLEIETVDGKMLITKLVVN